MEDLLDGSMERRGASHKRFGFTSFFVGPIHVELSTPFTLNDRSTNGGLLSSSWLPEGEEEEEEEVVVVVVVEEEEVVVVEKSNPRRSVSIAASCSAPLFFFLY
jgi:hypothetical protein